MVPISAHALFARPLVVAPDSVLAVEVLAQTEGAGVLWCDGRRTVDLPPGARIEVRRGRTPVRLVRLHEAPFTDRLVAKFGLPVEGWRGAAERRRRRTGGRAVIEEIRISSLGRDRGVGARARARAHRDHRRDRCRQDHARHRPRAAARRPRRLGRGPHGRPRGPRRGRGHAPTTALAAPPTSSAARSRTARLLLARQVSAEGRSRAFLGGASVPASALARVADALVAVHGQSDQHRLLVPRRSATRSTASPAPRWRR